MRVILAAGPLCEVVLEDLFASYDKAAAWKEMYEAVRVPRPDFTLLGESLDAHALLLKLGSGGRAKAGANRAMRTKNAVGLPSLLHI